MYNERVELYKKIEKEYNTKLLVYITGDRQNATSKIAPDVVDSFVAHLDSILKEDNLTDGTRIKDLSLFLYTTGGDIYAALTILNLLKAYCKKLRVIIPRKAQSAGTLISIGANEIVMTKQATIGPVDPSINSPFNPRVAGSNAPQQVSVEEVEGYIKFMKKELGLGDYDAIPKEVLLKLTDLVSPMTLGRVYRTRKLIRELVEKLLRGKVKDDKALESITDYLCEESGDHYYTINRYEAEERGFDITEPTQKQYEIIESIYKDICDDLKFNIPYYPASGIGSEKVKFGLIESISGGTDYYMVEYETVPLDKPIGGNTTQRSEVSSGWKHVGTDNAAENFGQVPPCEK